MRWDECSGGWVISSLFVECLRILLLSTSVAHRSMTDRSEVGDGDIHSWTRSHMCRRVTNHDDPLGIKLLYSLILPLVIANASHSTPPEYRVYTLSWMIYATALAMLGEKDVPPKEKQGQTKTPDASQNPTVSTASRAANM